MNVESTDVSVKHGYASSPRGPGDARRRCVNLALQGGGSHGAFTWGVLDRLLEEDAHIAFEGLSGSSAGAINAVVLVDGWIKAGAPGARTALTAFWSKVGDLMPPSMVVKGEGDSIELSSASQVFANWLGLFSPTQLNPLGVDPLRNLLASQLDFDAIRRESPFKLFVAATQANTGKLRVFREHELTVDVLMASTCLPKMHQPVDIDGEPYWDGGFSANPAVFPLLYDCASDDVLLVLLSPLRRDDAPRSVREIDDRITELTFSSTFMREMQSLVRAAEFSRQASGALGVLEAKLQALRVHMIDVCDLPSLQRTNTKALAHAPFMTMLRDQGRERAGLWLAKQAHALGRQSSVDVHKWFA